MSLPRANRLLQAWFALAFVACIAGCATAVTNGIPSARDAQAAMVIGKSSKADVEAALGKAVVVSFDSGYEVWVYREQPAAGSGLFGPPAKERTELVLLFEPAGILKKTRVRAPA